MDFGLDAVSDVSQELAVPAIKKQAVGSTKRDQLDMLQQMVVTIGKIALNSDMHIRAVRAILITCIKMPAESQWVVRAKAANVRYVETQKSLKTQGHNQEAIKKRIGIPAVHQFNAMLAYYLELIKDKKPDEYKNVQLAMKEWAGEGWKLVYSHFPHVKMCKMYDSGTRRLEIATPKMHLVDLDPNPSPAKMTPTHVWMLMKTEMLSLQGITEMEGQAPAGDLSRKIQEWLDSLKD